MGSRESGRGIFILDYTEIAWVSISFTFLDRQPLTFATQGKSTFGYASATCDAAGNFHSVLCLNQAKFNPKLN